MKAIVIYKEVFIKKIEIGEVESLEEAKQIFQKRQFNESQAETISSGKTWLEIHGSNNTNLVNFLQL